MTAEDRAWARALSSEELLASYRFAGPHKLTDRATDGQREWADAVVEELERRGRDDRGRRHARRQALHPQHSKETS
jgi:hypothetical protein